MVCKSSHFVLLKCPVRPAAVFSCYFTPIRLLLKWGKKNFEVAYVSYEWQTPFLWNTLKAISWMKWHVSFVPFVLNMLWRELPTECNRHTLSAVRQRFSARKKKQQPPKYPYTIEGINGVLLLMHDSQSATNTQAACPSSSPLIIRTRKKKQKKTE